MSVERIDALCCCEGCGKRFGVELDIAEELAEYPDFEELVRDTIRGGMAACYTWGVRGKATVDRFQLSYQATIQGGFLLCDLCSKKCDDLPIEGALTEDQVKKALGMEGEDE